MKPLEEILEAINESIEKYEACKLSFTHDQSEILRDLSANLYFLTEYRIQYNREWMSVYFASKAGSSVGKEREADFTVPHLYKVRHLMSSANKVLDSLRTTISANKNTQ